MVEQSGLSGGNDARPGVHARETAAQQPDPLGELRDDLGVVLRVLETMRPQGMGRHRTNKIAHSLAQARREIRRAIELVGAGPE